MLARPSVSYRLVEALLKADSFLKFKGENGNLYRVSDAYKDMTAFIQLDDGIESVVSVPTY